MTGPRTPLDDYYDALERLKNGNPKLVSKGIQITNDAVALEAGRHKGSIKRSRPVFTELIRAIAEVAAEQQAPTRGLEAQIKKIKLRAQKNQEAYEQSLMIELSLLRQLHELDPKIRTKPTKVEDIRSAKSPRLR